MQGRLLPPVNGRLQAFPGKDWIKEFSLAKECGLDAIELIFDIERIVDNPLNTDEGLKIIQDLTERFGIKVISVCADYFMSKGFLRETKQDREENIKVLEELTWRCHKVGIKYIVVPFVDQAEIKTNEELNQVRDSLLTALENTNGCDVIYALEMSLPGDTIGRFLEKIDHPRLKVNYDTGNSTSLGYDLVSEIERLQSLIVDVHIKDKKYYGESCLLGEGDTDFDVAFEAFARINYRGPFLLQAQRGVEEIVTAKNQMKFVRDKIVQYYSKKKEDD